MSTENPYASPSADLGTSGGERRYVGFWMRVLAAIIDSILLMVVLLPLIYFMFGSGVLTGEETAGAAYLIISYGLPFAIYVFLWAKYGGTPGKRLLKMKIVSRDTGEHLSYGMSAVRYIGYILSMMALFIGLIWVGFQREKRGWHDLMAGSVVVYD